MGHIDAGLPFNHVGQFNAGFARSLEFGSSVMSRFLDGFNTTGTFRVSFQHCLNYHNLTPESKQATYPSPLTELGWIVE